MGILLGLIAALSWGAGDFVLSRINRALGPMQSLLYVQMVGTIIIGLFILITGDIPPLDPQLWLLTVGVNILNVLGTLLLYRALAVGTLSIVSPVAASFAVITTMLALAAGERPAPLALSGVALVMGGVIVVSRSAEPTPAATKSGDVASFGFAQGTLAAMGAAVCYGIFFWLLSPVREGLGIAWPVLVGRVMAVGVALLGLGLRRTAPLPLPRRLWGTVVLVTIVDTLGFLSYNLGIGTAYVSVVTALASIFSAVTVLLAWVVLRERLASLQWAGVAAVLVGVLLVSM